MKYGSIELTPSVAATCNNLLSMQHFYGAYCAPLEHVPPLLDMFRPSWACSALLEHVPPLLGMFRPSFSLLRHGFLKKEAFLKNFRNEKIHLSSAIAFYRRAVYCCTPRNKVPKRDSEKGAFLTFFRFPETGSSERSPKIVKFNSARQKLSIDMQFITVLLETKFLFKGSSEKEAF